MADDWDDWGDDGSEKSEGWDWPGAEVESRSTKHEAAEISHRQPEVKNSASVEEREARRAAVDDMAESFFAKLRRYLEDLADPSVREAINQELTKSDYASLALYYDGREDLISYTLDTELRRMKYSVVTEDGRRLGGGQREGEGDENEEGGGGGNAVREYLSGRRGDAMLHMANQSVFADMLEAIQGRLLRPDLEISVISRDCEFCLDFSRGVLEAQSLFDVSTVGGGGPGALETLEIAHIRGTVFVDTRSQVCSQRLLSPQLRMVFDDAMRASARVLALHCFMGMGDFDTSVGGGSNTGLQRMGSLRTSLARVSSDGMGRAAAAGTGLLANVVAGVGYAVGASRAGTEGSSFFGEGGGNGGNGGGLGASTGHSAAPLMQVYKKTGPAEKTRGRTAGASSDAYSTSRTSVRSVDRRAHATDSDAGGGASSFVPEVHDDPGVGDRDTFTGAVTGARGREDGIERRSALGIASATGGAVLWGLWGGVRSAAAAGVAAGISARQGSAGAGTAPRAVAGGSRESESTPALRLYRREGDDS